MDKKKVVIVGAGFGGIRTALDLATHKGFDVTIISKGTCFEYYPGLHKIVGVSEHATYAIPLATIFKGKNVNVITGEVTHADPQTKTVTLADGQAYTADFLVIAIGSQTAYFGIPGLAEQAFGFKSVAEAKRLRTQVDDAFRKHVHSEKSEQVLGLHFVVVGAGPNGVDVAGELAYLGRQLAERYKIPASLMTVDLIEGSPRVLPMLPESVSEHVTDRLRDLGVNVMCNRELREQDSWTIELADMKIGAKTLVWTAGITTNELVKKIPGLVLAKKDRVVVDQYLQAKGFENVFVIGDAADTQYAGLAQTALYDGSYVARTIMVKSRGVTLRAYRPKPVAFNIGTGPRWSVMMVGGFVMYGIIPYLLRTVIDIKFFLSILPVREVWNLYAGHKKS